MKLPPILGSVSALSYAYVDANQLLSETQQIATDGGPKSVVYTYNDDSKRETLNYPSGSSVTYGYNGRDLLNSISATGGGRSRVSFRISLLAGRWATG